MGGCREREGGKEGGVVWMGGWGGEAGCWGREDGRAESGKRGETRGTV